MRGTRFNSAKLSRGAVIAPSNRAGEPRPYIRLTYVNMVMRQLRALFVLQFAFSQVFT